MLPKRTERTLRFFGISVLYLGAQCTVCVCICYRCNALSARTVQQSLDASITKEPRSCEAPTNVAKKKQKADKWKHGRGLLVITLEP